MKLFLDVAATLYEAKSFYDVGKIIITILQKLANNQNMDSRIGIYDKEVDEYRIYYNSDDMSMNDYGSFGNEIYKITNTPCKFSEIKYFSRIVADSREKLIIQDNHSIEALKIHPAQEQFEPHAMMWIPLLYKDDFLGIISLGCKPANSLTDEIIENVEGIAKLTSIKISELFTSNNLIKKEEKFRTLFETMVQGVVYQSEDGKIISANSAAERILGMTLDQMQGRTSMDPLWRAIHEDGSDFPGDTHPAMVALKTGKEVHDVVMGVSNSKRKNYTWININAIPIFREEEKPYQVYATFQDITEQKKAEIQKNEALEALKKSEEKNISMLNAIPDIMFQISKDGVFIDYYTTNVQNLLVAPDSFIGKNIMNVLPKELAERTLSHLNDIFEVGKTEPYEYELEIGSEIRFFESRMVLCQKDSVLCIIRDITERKRGEEALLESETKFRALFEKGPIGVAYHRMIYDDVGKAIDYYFIDANESYQRLTGVDPRGKTVTQAFPGIENDPFDWIGTFGKVAKTGETIHFEQYLQTNDRWYNCVGYQYKLDHFVAAFLEITERKRAEESLRESESRFRSYTENAPIGVFVCDETGRYLEVNPAATTITGYTKEELLSMSIPDLLPPESLEFVAHQFQRVATIGRTSSEFAFRHKVGGIRLWSLEGVRLSPTRFMGLVIDITERKQAEKELAETKVLLNAAFEQSPVPMALVSVPDNVFRFVNTAAANFLGILAKDYVNKPLSEVKIVWKDLTPDGHPIEISELPMPRAIGGISTENMEILVERGDGTKRWELISGAPIFDANEKLIAGMIVFPDITERKLVERDLIESHNQLEKTLVKLEETQRQVLQQEKLRSLGQLASGVCHDINNSLTPIMGFLDLLTRDKGLMERSKKYIDMVIQSTKNIASTIGRLKEFYKVKLEDDDLKEKDINRIIITTIELTSHKWRNIAESTGSVIEIKRELQKDLPLTKVDESELIEALTNIILNACDSMIDGGILTFRTYQKEDNIVIEVQDTGMGMDEETLKRCMDPFYSTKGEQGTGLGLSMVFGVMDRHKGEIKIESEKNKGTTVKLILPVDKSIIENIKIDEIIKDLKPLKILSVEDDKVISEMLKLILETKGNRVESALNGKVGLELYKQAIEKIEPFDLVITDLGMAEMDGNSLSKLIKESTPDVPVILLTGWGTLIDKNDYKTVDCLLKKPIMMEDLFKAIAGLFGDK